MCRSVEDLRGGGLLERNPVKTRSAATAGMVSVSEREGNEMWNVARVCGQRSKVFKRNARQKTAEMHGRELKNKTIPARLRSMQAQRADRELPEPKGTEEKMYCFALSVLLYVTSIYKRRVNSISKLHGSVSSGDVYICIVELRKTGPSCSEGWKRWPTLY